MSTVHWHQGRDAETLARQALLAMLPGLAASAWLLGAGLLRNLVIAAVTAAVGDSLVRLLRRLPVSGTMLDPGIAMTAMIVALLLPTNSAWWAPVVASAFAVALASPLLGGPGRALLHPAMSGLLFALLLAPQPVSASALPSSAWINAGFLVGGLYMLRAQVVPWQIPASLLLSLAGCRILFGPAVETGVSSLLTVISAGQVMLLAFFIAPAFGSSAITPWGRLVYGALLGGLVAALDSGSAGIATSVLLANFCAPLLDQLFGPAPVGTPANGGDHP